MYNIAPSQNVETYVMTILRKSSVCPNCASLAIHRSKRKGLLEHVLHSALFITPYRCGSCDQRYFRFRFSSLRANKQHHHAV
jgi:hypothetical protein